MTLFGPAGGATVDPTGRYRYRLWRRLYVAPDLPERRVVFVMLNPSTAGAMLDDQTIRRCRFFASREGATEMEVVNLFAWRATRPRDLLRVPDPVGPENDAWIARAASSANLIVLAYGRLARRAWWDRADEVLEILGGRRSDPVRRPLWTLGSTADGFPRHPSRLPNDAELERF